jgi:hypothetical protein
MCSIEKTAYPLSRKEKIKSTELSASYSLCDDEIKMIIWLFNSKHSHDWATLLS